MNNATNQSEVIATRKTFDERLIGELGCCRFHGEGGTRELTCGGDSPNQGGKHSQRCAYFAGGDCTCGYAAPDCDEPTEEEVRAAEEFLSERARAAEEKARALDPSILF